METKAPKLRISSDSQGDFNLDCNEALLLRNPRSFSERITARRAKQHKSIPMPPTCLSNSPSFSVCASAELLIRIAPPTVSTKQMAPMIPSIFSADCLLVGGCFRTATTS